MLPEHHPLRGRRSDRFSRSASYPLRRRASTGPAIRPSIALLVGPSVAANQWVASVADSAGFSVSSQVRFDSLWSATATSADIVLLEAQRAERHAVLAAIEGASTATRRHILLLTWQLHWDTIEPALALQVADFQVMPCRSEELLTRMRAVAVRAMTRDSVFDSFDVGPADSPAASLSGTGCQVRLTARERAVYRVLAAREGEVVSRADLLAAVWRKTGMERNVSNVVDVYVRFLRVKLATAMPDVTIETVKRAGYLLRRKALKS